MAKVRVGIPVDLATEIMFSSDNTCCVCQERGKALQLHHIDEDPSNNVAMNLALLCLECHNDTQLKGGFGRKLNAPLVTRYRDEWLERVTVRRTKADEQAVSRQVEPYPQPIPEPSAPEHIPREAPLAYINSLPAFKSELKKHAQPEWDSGVTSRMVIASYEYIDALQGILVTLAQYFSPQQFGGKAPQKFFAEAIAARFRWHRAHAEPGGPGTGGTIVNVICAGNVMSDVERMVEELVTSLAGYNDSFDWKGWPERWRT
jgi:hypothetical protein